MISKKEIEFKLIREVEYYKLYNTTLPTSVRCKVEGYIEGLEYVLEIG